MPTTQRFEVLVADRNTLIRECLKKIASKTGDLTVVDEATSTDEALVRLGSRRYDLIVTEIAVSGRADLDGIRFLKAASPDTPVLVLSALNEQQYAPEALRAGASGYLGKECGSEVLIAVMRKLARGGVFVSANVAEAMARRSPRSEPEPGALSKRERQIFAMISAGQRMSRIAGSLGISVKTVSTHKTRILEKLGVGNEVELIRYAIDHRLMHSEPTADEPGDCRRPRSEPEAISMA